MPLLNLFILVSLSLTLLTLPPSALRSSGDLSQDSTSGILLDDGMVFLAIGDGNAWVWNSASQVLQRIDLSTSLLNDTRIAFPVEPWNASIESGALWILGKGRDHLIRVNLTTHEIAATIDLKGYFAEWEYVTVVTGEGTVWLKGEETVLQVDPETNQVLGKPIPAGDEVIVAVIADGELWTGSHDDGLVTRIDLRTQEIIAQFDIGFSVHGLAVGDQTAWILDEHGFAVVEVDLGTNTAGTRIPIDFVASNITYADGGVWVAPAARDSGVRLGNDTFIRIDAATKEIVDSVEVGDITSPTDGYYLGVYEEGEAWAVIYDEQMRLVRLPKSSHRSLGEL